MVTLNTIGIVLVAQEPPMNLSTKLQAVGMTLGFQRHHWNGLYFRKITFKYTSPCFCSTSFHPFLLPFNQAWKGISLSQEWFPLNQKTVEFSPLYFKVSGAQSCKLVEILFLFWMFSVNLARYSCMVQSVAGSNKCLWYFSPPGRQRKPHGLRIYVL